MSCPAETSRVRPIPITGADISLPRRCLTAHKGDFGKLLIVGGSVGYTGAPNMAAWAAVRSGAGLVYLGVPEKIWTVCAVKNTEAMPFPLPCDEQGRLTAEAVGLLRERWEYCNVLAIGPGLGRSQGVCAVTEAALDFPGPLVLDADALWAVSRAPELLRRAKGRAIITPHAGEFARLGGAVTGDRTTDAVAFSREYGCVTVLKGHPTLIAFPEGEVYTVLAGNPGMAKGGSGDVLTGTLAALLGQLPEKKAVLTAAWAHSAAGDRCAADRGEYGMTPTDIIETLPTVLKEITEKNL